MGWIYDIPEHFLNPEEYYDFLQYILGLPIGGYLKKQMLLEWSDHNDKPVIVADIRTVYPEEIT